MAICYDDTTNLIWLLGGSDSLISLISFNTSIWNKPNAFIDHVNNTLSYPVWSDGQVYTQTEAVIYVIQSPVWGTLVASDISTGFDTTNTNPSTINFRTDGCLASFEDWIIYTLWRNIYILNASNLSWTFIGTPSMSTSRKYHSCTIEPDEGHLYIIGGHESGFETYINNTRYLDTIEKLYVKDIANINRYNFTTLTNTLTSAKRLTRAILYKTNIFVVGGDEKDSESDSIDLIDTRTDSVILWGRLYEGIHAVSPIIVAGRLYVFGGWVNGSSVDYWQYFDMFRTYIFIFVYICMVVDVI